MQTLRILMQIITWSIIDTIIVTTNSWEEKNYLLIMKYSKSFDEIAKKKYHLNINSYKSFFLYGLFL